MLLTIEKSEVEDGEMEEWGEGEWDGKSETVESDRFEDYN